MTVSGVPKARSNCANTSAGPCLLLVHVKGGPTNPISSKLQSSITLLKFSICQRALVALLRYSLFMRISLKSPNTNHGRWCWPESILNLSHDIYLFATSWRPAELRNNLRRYLNNDIFRLVTCNPLGGSWNIQGIIILCIFFFSLLSIRTFSHLLACCRYTVKTPGSFLPCCSLRY